MNKTCPKCEEPYLLVGAPCGDCGYQEAECTSCDKEFYRYAPATKWVELT